ncbi:MupA/Atu3671 family FMN-dependent luciferase-like monooxygenase [Paenibacillus lutrae]|uniref:MupA/Atu3671 family FMN-dependent luciferase-like monooxygenase n=1 Tax=Paenibacillus lutrae TaxID=2078573 RepID=UPI0012FB3200|nr:MupA/Atu3671 family FMN-dependent luciferase-like monooxygenase [Paenibacillus lutrae]
MNKGHNVDFSLFFFSSSDDQSNTDKYKLVLEGAKFADQNKFKAVWTPERHFHPFGGIFPNSSVLSAALAMITQEVQIRAGSVVSPLHHTARIVEDWSLVDNLSGGRVGVSFATGWHADDFLIKPDHFEDKSSHMLEQIKQARELWSGKSLSFPNGENKQAEVKTYPRPIQGTLPVWITTSGREESFVNAGRLGTHVLTHLLYQDVDMLERHIKAYRKSLQENGFDADAGCVTVMVHTFVGKNLEEVKQTVKEPFLNYLTTSIDLMQALNMNGKKSNDPKMMETMLNLIFERYWSSAALFGTPESCSKFAEKLVAIGVNEIACLIDFGVETNAVLDSLNELVILKEKVNHHFTAMS